MIQVVEIEALRGLINGVVRSLATSLWEVDEIALASNARDGRSARGKACRARPNATPNVGKRCRRVIGRGRDRGRKPKSSHSTPFHWLPHPLRDHAERPRHLGSIGIARESMCATRVMLVSVRLALLSLLGPT